MTVIKFRAWDKRSGIYLYNVQDAYDTLSGFVKYDNGEDAEYDESCFGDFLDNKRYDIEQFTGLKDVNGEDIYENDLIKVVYQYWGQLGNRYEVRFKQGAFCVKYDLLSEISPSILVIGNVHTDGDLIDS